MVSSDNCDMTGRWIEEENLQVLAVQWNAHTLVILSSKNALYYLHSPHLTSADLLSHPPAFFTYFHTLHLPFRLVFAELFYAKV